jgi:hypothetical protein
MPSLVKLVFPFSSRKRTYIHIYPKCILMTAFALYEILCRRQRDMCRVVLFWKIFDYVCIISNCVRISRLLDSSDFPSLSPIPSDVTFPVIPRVRATSCLGSALLSDIQSWFRQHHVRLCVWIATKLIWAQLFLFKFCLVFFPDAVSTFRLGKPSKLKPGSGQQFHWRIVVDVISVLPWEARAPG